MSTSAALGIDAGKSPEQLFQERLKRIIDALQCKQPDRIPILLAADNWVADLGGITRMELNEEPEKRDKALAAASLRFQPDCCFNVATDSKMSRMLGDRMTKWPGYSLEPNVSFQFNENEFMKPEDYDDFIDDPADFAIRKYLPRAFSELAPLAMLPPLAMANFGYYGLGWYLPTLGIPPVKKAFELLGQAADYRLQFFARLTESLQYLQTLGFAPPIFFIGPLIEAPFDFMSDTMRGMSGIFMDMHFRPEKLLAAEKKVIKFELEAAIAQCRALNQSYAFIPLHRGSDGFMSIKDFEKFYWPQLKEIIVRLVEEGITPTVFYEGVWDDRLQHLAELPKGKTVGWFQYSDIFKVKEVLGTNMCIMGGMRVSMLNGAASASEIREHTHKLCEVVGKGGGFIMSTDIGEMEGSRPELVEAWVNATKEFGKY
jgi:hypothetical protein